MQCAAKAYRAEFGQHHRRRRNDCYGGIDIPAVDSGSPLSTLQRIATAESSRVLCREYKAYRYKTCSIGQPQRLDQVAGVESLSLSIGSESLTVICPIPQRSGDIVGMPLCGREILRCSII